MSETTIGASIWRANMRIADHELVRPVGRGAFGEVWLARSLATSRFRAVKVVERARFAQDRPYDMEFSGVRRFEEVSREHEGFVDILHVCRDDAAGYFAYVMEMADPLEPGPQFSPETYSPRTLAAELERQGKLRPGECVRIGLAMASALAALHQRRLVHRDLKPSNIVFIRGAPKLADVGLVTDLRELPPDTLAGTPDYMDADVHGTAAGDLFSLGKLLYVMASGKGPRDWPAWPSSAPEDQEVEVVKELAAICQRACEPERKRRYESAEQIHADLAVLQSGHSFTRLKRLERLVRLGRRWGTIVGLTALLAGVGHFQWYQARVHRAKLNERKVGAYTAYGSRALEENDLLGSLPWFTEALRLDADNPRNAETHRLRLAAVLGRAPTLVQMLFTTQAVSFACFAGQENQLLARAADGRWAVLDVASGRRIYPAFGSGPEPQGICLHPPTGLAMTTDGSATARLWDIRTGEPRPALTNAGDLYGAALSRDGQWAAAISDEHNIAIWNTRSNVPAHLLTGPTNQLLCLAFSPDAKRIVASGQPHEAVVWDIAAQKPILWLTNDEEVYCAAFSPDGGFIATGSLDRSARIWDAATGRELPPRLRHEDGVWSLEFSADGQRLATAGLDFTARVWDLKTRTQLVLLPHNSKVVCVGFSPQGRYLVTATVDGTVRVWDLQQPAAARARPRAGFSGNGRRMAEAQPGLLRLLDTHGERPVAELPLTNSLGAKPLLSRDGAKVVTVEWWPSSPGTTNLLARRWDCAGASLRPAGSVPLRADMSGYELSPSGACLLAYGKAGAGVWDLGSGRQLLKLAAPVQLGSFDPAGERLAIGSSKEVQVWSLRSGRPLLASPWRHHTQVSSIEWSANGRYVVTTCWDTTFDPEFARVWDAETGLPVGPPLQHRDGVCFAAFNHRGNQVITCSEDFTAMLWEPATGRQLTPPLRHPDRVFHAAFSENDRWIATICDDASVRLWDAADGELLAPPLLHSPPSRRWADFAGIQWLDQDRRLAAWTEAETPWLWDLPRDTRPIGDLVGTAKLLSAEQIYESEAIGPLTKAVLYDLWQDLSVRYPEKFSLRP